uniref:Fruit weight 2.2-1 protein n=1 Tax=Dimocarpus longan TaxID=128017 RepID=I6RAV5_9ROSI|nr:fruit weight 2.2-1 protein [Dimocarpus longan]
MYPSVNDAHGCSTDGLPSPVPPSGIPSTGPGQPYAPPPPYIARVRVQAGQWSTGFCHCCDDPANCFITCFCPCITFGQIAEIVDRGSTSCAANGTIYGLLAMTGFACLYSCCYRSKLRGQYDLEESPCVDCLAHFCCEPCALCQEYRELKNRGFDMGIGWEANMDRQNRRVTAAPILAPGMTRW